jgi:hypothetical protein
MQWAHRCWAVVTTASILMLAACSKDSSAPATDPFAGGWNGVTSQGRPAQFLVADDGVVLAVIGFQVVGTVCTDDVLLIPARDPSEAPYPISGGTLTVSTSGSAGSVSFTGTLSGTDASGTLTVNAVACNGTGNFTWTATKATGADINVAGGWSGTFESNLLPTTNGTITMSQSGATVTGSYANDAGAAGTVNATVSGRMATFRLNQTTPGCPGRYDGYATRVPLGAEDLVYFYAGQDCLGEHTDGFGVAQPVPLGATHAGPRPAPGGPRLAFDY